MSPRLAWISAFLMAAGLALPIGYYEEDLVYWSQFPLSAMFVAFGIAAVVAGERWLRHLAKGELWAWLGPITVLVAGVGPFMLPTAELAMRTSSDGFASVAVSVFMFLSSGRQRRTASASIGAEPLSTTRRSTTLTSSRTLPGQV